MPADDVGRDRRQTNLILIGGPRFVDMDDRAAMRADILRRAALRRSSAMNDARRISLNFGCGKRF